MGMDYARNLQKNWGATTGATAAASRTPGRPGRPRGRTSGTRSRTTSKNTGRILNAAAATSQSAGLPSFASDLANALGNVAHACAVAGFPVDVAQSIIADGYSQRR